MARISQQRINQILTIGYNASNTAEKGRALEDLICYLFSNVIIQEHSPTGFQEHSPSYNKSPLPES
jgi:hypothetical protein